MQPFVFHFIKKPLQFWSLEFMLGGGGGGVAANFTNFSKGSDFCQIEQYDTELS